MNVTWQITKPSRYFGAAVLILSLILILVCYSLFDDIKYKKDVFQLFGVYFIMSFIISFVVQYIIYSIYNSSRSNDQYIWFLINALVLIGYIILVYYFMAKEGFGLVDGMRSLKDINYRFSTWELGSQGLLVTSGILHIGITILITGFRMKNSNQAFNSPKFLKN